MPLSRQLGIAGGEQGAVTGAELARLDDGQLRETVRRCSVFTSVRPEQKLRIVDALPPTTRWSR